MASRIGTVLAASALATAGLSLASPQNAEAEPADLLLIGHRGAAGTAPENTVAAFKDARASGVDMFEVDVQLSADGVPFLFHDNTPARTTDVEEVFPDRAGDPITSFTWEELQQLDAGSFFGERFAGERIPHLDDAARIGTRATGVYIEIKTPVNSPGVEQVVADALESDPQWQKLVDADKVTVIGFDETSNRTFAELAPDVPLQQLSGTVPAPDVLESWTEFADSVGTNYRNLTAEQAADVEAAGLDLGVYTVNAPTAVQDVIDLGVDAITSDFPVQTRRYVEGRPAVPTANGIEIADSINNAPGDDVQPENGEHVVLRNTTGHSIDVSGYYLRDAAGNILHVGDGYVLAPGGELRVYTASGTNTADRYYNGRTSAVLNNGGESLGLWAPQHRLLDLFAN